MRSKAIEMVFVARINRHKLWMIYAFFDFFVQKIFLTKNYFLTAEINFTTRGQLYTCLVLHELYLPLLLPVKIWAESFHHHQTRDLSAVKVFPDSLIIKAVSDGIIINHKNNPRATLNHRSSHRTWVLLVSCSFDESYLVKKLRRPRHSNKQERVE